MSTLDKIRSTIDALPEDRRDMALLGVEIWGYAHVDEDMPAYIKSAVWAANYEIQRQKKLAEDAARPTPPQTTDDNPNTGIPLGTIAGCPVIGHYRDDAPHTLYSADLTWQELNISTDGDTYLNIEPLDDETDCVGDMCLSVWPTIRELAHTDVVEQLIMLARRKTQQP